MSSKESKIKYILLESFLVVFGVVLAFAINEYREHNEKTETSETALISVVDELKNNYQIAQEAFEYHSYLIDTLSTYYRKDEVPKNKIFLKGFIYRRYFVKDSYKTALSSNSFYDVDYKMLLTFSELYTLFDKYNAQKEKVGSMIYELSFKEGFQAVSKNYKNLMNVIRNFKFLEQEIIKNLDELKKNRNLW